MDQILRYLESVATPGETLFTWTNMVATLVPTNYTIGQFYILWAISSRPEIAGARTVHSLFNKFPYILIGLISTEELKERFPGYHMLKSYENLLIPCLKEATIAAPTAVPRTS